MFSKCCLVAGILFPALCFGFPRYNDGCQNCHGAFTDDTSPKGTVFPSDSKHEMHRSASNMNTDCDLCHSRGDEQNPFMNVSNGTASTTGHGCVGCHGRDYGVFGVQARGLRAHHLGAGVDLCSFCHDDGTPWSEDVLPPYYGSPDTDADDPCNTSPDRLENWSLDLDNEEGLDNDGDGFYDENDPDCAAPPCRCGDLTENGFTNLEDFATFAGCFNTVAVGACECSDLTGNGFINLEDFATFAGLFNQNWNGQAPPNCS